MESVLIAPADVRYWPGNNTTQGRTAIGGATHVSDVDNWQFRFRVHRDFYP